LNEKVKHKCTWIWIMHLKIITCTKESLKTLVWNIMIIGWNWETCLLLWSTCMVLKKFLTILMCTSPLQALVYWPRIVSPFFFHPLFYHLLCFSFFLFVKHLWQQIIHPLMHLIQVRTHIEKTWQPLQHIHKVLKKCTI